MSSILEKVTTEWESDARHEQDSHYYIPGAELSRVLNGSRCFITGRKGTGKTALAKYINFKVENSILLDFNRFKYQSFFKFKDESYSASSKYVNIWVYVVYMAALERIYNIDPEALPKNSLVLDRLKQVNKTSTVPIISRILALIPGAKLNGGGLGVEATVQFGTPVPEKEFEVEELNRILENTIKKISFKSNSYVLVDDIDTDINTKSLDKIEYKNLLSSLLDATLYVRNQKLNILPVVFMREDLYRSLPNINKWSDLRIRLSWNTETISMFIKSKINMLTECGVDQEDGVSRLFTEGGVKKSSGRVELLDYIVSYSQRRPRDVIKYIKIAAEYAQSLQLERINPQVVKSNNVLDQFSEHMIEEIKEELKYVYDDVESIFDSIQACRNSHFRYLEIALQLKNHLGCNESKCISIVHDLYNCGAIGNHVNSREIFTFTDPSSKLQIERGMLVHRSLISGLQLF